MGHSQGGLQVVPIIVEQRVPLAKLWFQQDGATPQTARRVLNFLGATFPAKVISKKGEVLWPPRSRNLTVPDYWLWGHLKNEVYRRPVHSLGQLKRRIREAAGRVPHSMMKAAYDNLPYRLRACLHRRGGHLEHVLPRS